MMASIGLLCNLKSEETVVLSTMQQGQDHGAEIDARSLFWRDGSRFVVVWHVGNEV
jgi:hypothetical protein